MKKVMMATLVTFGLFTAGAQAGYTLDETRACATSNQFQNCVIQLSEKKASPALTDMDTAYTKDEVRACGTANDFHVCADQLNA
ncbi:hypothetical protein [Enterovibrio nigricans]|uniref:Uncharacterized protein n=1 Tax=Enterovibrio nigricans DSM 22720 TaxID=1121868 RepID=A0A1T4UGM8_9GAMM|nr:hypothetical protein [Enterovibrio nigricans]SKA51942.1 hypothetical protein SAMN02745132_01728 [Enterovibrio nigricans DSM 22720]